MVQKSRILVIEDEKDVKDLILLHLKREGHQTDAAENGEEALHLIQKNTYQLVVLDWMLPGLSGLEICKKINRKLPVLMVTARADTSDIVLGLEMGADDYITKPFEVSVLLARVRALLRRSAAAPTKDTQDRLQIGDLSIDLHAHRVTGGGEEIPLTPSEFKLLCALMQNQGRVLSRDKLIELVQGQGVAVIDRAIDTHVFGLRKKLGPFGDLIETIRGVGYRVEAKPNGISEAKPNGINEAKPNSINEAKLNGISEANASVNAAKQSALDGAKPNNPQNAIPTGPPGGKSSSSAQGIPSNP